MKSITIFRGRLVRFMAVVIACGLAASSAWAGYIVTVEQVGPNVVATGSGPIDLTGLGLDGSIGQIGFINAPFGNVVTGPSSSTLTNYYGGIHGPGSFGSAGGNANSGTGDIVGVQANNGLLFVPAGYTSGSALSDSSTYNNATISSLGIDPGTYEWTWGSGGVDQNFTLKILAPTVPDSGFSALLLGFACLALLGAVRVGALRKT